jgi:hypothetical protein
MIQNRTRKYGKKYGKRNAQTEKDVTHFNILYVLLLLAARNSGTQGICWCLMYANDSLLL